MPRPLTILFPTGSFFPAQNGGPDNTVYWITKALKRAGHHPIVATTTSGLPAGTTRGEWLSTDYGEAIYTENPVHYLPLRLTRTAFGRLKEADVLHLTMITYPVGLLMALLNSLTYGKPMLWSSRGDLDPHILQRSYRKKRLMIWLIRTFVRQRRLWFHSTCAAETRYIRKHFGDGARVVEIPNYMELPAYLDLAKERYLLYVGRIDAKKAIENLIAAVGRSDAFLNSDFTLKIVGDHANPYGEQLVRQVASAGLQERVLFLGHRSGMEKERLLGAAWFTLMPSHTENFGIVVLEAMAQGTPAVASHGTPWQSLEDHGAGYWVHNSPDSLVRVIDRIINTPPEEIRAMGQRGLRLSRERFNIHANIGEWVAAYRRILQDTQTHSGE